MLILNVIRKLVNLFFNLIFIFKIKLNRLAFFFIL